MPRQVVFRRPGRAGLVLAAVFLLSGCAALIQGAWIPAKAELAQWLIARSWQQQLSGQASSPPWPWADTYPVARLSVPGSSVSLFVLAGSSARNLAFGPALLGEQVGSPDWVVSGHRDTHFGFLAELAPGDELLVESRLGKERFTVVQREIIDSRNNELILDPAVRRISLVTCYPFDAVSAGGPLRFVVTAVPANRSTADSNGISRRFSSSG